MNYIIIADRSSFFKHYGLSDTIRDYGIIRIEYFVNEKLAGTIYNGKKVISFHDIKGIYKDEFVVVATAFHRDKYLHRLHDMGITKCFEDPYYEGLYAKIGSHFPLPFIKKPIRLAQIYKKSYPLFPTYKIYGQDIEMRFAEIFANYKLYKYKGKKIAIYGINEMTTVLVSEVAYQTSYESIVGICDPIIKTGDVVGIPICSSFDELVKDIDCLIINIRRRDDNIRFELEKNGCSYDKIDVFDIDQFVPIFRHPELARFKNIHKGERCFIIGNGPSLKIEDLNTLHEHNEICFGVNTVFWIYNKTQWRADYLCIADACVTEDDFIKKQISHDKLFLAETIHEGASAYFENANYLHFQRDPAGRFYPGFSSDITELTRDGYTVVYSLALQIAAYMGFKLIYILGVDNTFLGHFYDLEHPSKINVEKQEALDESAGANSAFEYADFYSRHHGFRIYNATRGGKLETLERVDFDSLFHK